MSRSIRGALVAILIGCPLLLAAGCGNSRTPVPSLSTPAPPGVDRVLRFPAEGLSIKAPSNWTVTAGHGRLVAVVSSGDAVVALWRDRSAPGQPTAPSALRRARRALVRDARGRDPNLQLISSTIGRVDGFPAVELNALEHIAGHLRRVSSSHVFEPGGEVVLEAYAPPQLFRAVDHAVFEPLRHSLLVIRSSRQSRR